MFVLSDGFYRLLLHFILTVTDAGNFLLAFCKSFSTCNTTGNLSEKVDLS